MEQFQCWWSSAFKKPKENIERLLINKQKAEPTRWVTYVLNWPDQPWFLPVVQCPNHLAPVFPNKSVSVWMINYMATPIRHWCSLFWGVLQYLWSPTGRSPNSLVCDEGFDLPSQNAIRHTHYLQITPDWLPPAPQRGGPQLLKGEDHCSCSASSPAPHRMEAPPHSSRLSSAVPPLGGPPWPPLRITLPIPLLAPGPAWSIALSWSPLMYYNVKNGGHRTRLFLP